MFGALRESTVANYFTSDWHLGHESIINWERTQFNSIQEHDEAILDFVRKLAKKIKPGDNVYMLGDYGDTDKLWYIDELTHVGAHTIFIAGNHDKLADKEKFEAYFDEVYWHPIYLSERIVVSHFPQAIWEGQVSVHGHNHGSIIDAPGYITCSINDTDFTPITDKHINSAFGKVGKFETKFLYEPWADMYKFTKRDTSDLIVDQNGKIDLSATRAYKKFQNDLTS